MHLKWLVMKVPLKAFAFVLGAAGAGGLRHCWGGKAGSSFEVVRVSTVGMHWGIRRAREMKGSSPLAAVLILIQTVVT